MEEEGKIIFHSLLRYNDFIKSWYFLPKCGYRSKGDNGLIPFTQTKTILATYLGSGERAVGVTKMLFLMVTSVILLSTGF